ncbi:MAG: phosphoglucomutase (alpha-D-glucose-1,6-bisphosphate-dependent) [Bifidobacteriaceae bacterium]|jgi:phosphoglucomutase|nr:phosphoglucomutase (alpha-D-glucose-1,6-bisphosphate-dependent) [Bifidobacteriaceae bacterium]
MHPRAGQSAEPADLIDIKALEDAYYDIKPDPSHPSQRVVFGTSGHRGSSLDGAFNEQHIIAITAAIIEYRRDQGIDGPLFLGRDTHGLSLPAWRTAVEVLGAAGVELRVDARDSFTPTPALSHAILVANGSTAPTGLRTAGPGLADGIVITPSHNPPRDGGFKYNPPDGGPADTAATAWIARRANAILAEGMVDSVRRVPVEKALALDSTKPYEFLSIYVNDLVNVVNLDAIRSAGVRIGADPLGGASVDYWGAIGERYRLDLTVINDRVDPAWRFMTLDWDGKIRMDPSSPFAMASLRSVLEHPGVDGRPAYDIATGNDADSDRHGIVTPDGGLMNPNHYLAACVAYLFSGNRPGWSDDAAVGKTVVSSSLIDRVADNEGRALMEVPVGFKWFVPGLLNGSVAFGGEESAGASFLRLDGRVWTTDKDGIILALLASEILAVGGISPSRVYDELADRFGRSWYARVDAPADRGQKAALAALDASQVTDTELAGDPITARLVKAPGNDAPIGGLKVETERAWFAARPSGTEDVYKIYAESFVSAEHLSQVQAAAKDLVDAVIAT